MLFKSSVIQGIQYKSFKSVKVDLENVKKEYLELTDVLKDDTNDYYTTVFLKIVFIFHKTLKRILKLRSMHTFPELIDEYEHLSSKNYDLGKVLKLKEDELLSEANKDLFYAKKKELEEIYLKKTYFSVIEKNILMNNVIFELRSFTEKLEEMQYSGKEIKKEDVVNVLDKCDGYIKRLTDITKIEEDMKKNSHNFLSHIIDGHNPETEKKEKKEEESKKENLETKRKKDNKISNYLKVGFIKSMDKIKSSVKSFSFIDSFINKSEKNNKNDSIDSNKVDDNNIPSETAEKFDSEIKNEDKLDLSVLHKKSSSPLKKKKSSSPPQKKKSSSPLKKKKSSISQTKSSSQKKSSISQTKSSSQKKSSSSQKKSSSPPQNKKSSISQKKSSSQKKKSSSSPQNKKSSASQKKSSSPLKKKKSSISQKKSSSPQNKKSSSQKKSKKSKLSNDKLSSALKSLNNLKI